MQLPHHSGFWGSEEFNQQLVSCPCPKDDSGEGWFGCCYLDLQQSQAGEQEAPWPLPVPATRGGQKKAALSRKESERRSFKGHASLGTLRTTLGSSKSYITTATPEPKMPGLVTEVTAKQAQSHNTGKGCRAAPIGQNPDQGAQS